jgi:fibronectin type III domain protein
VTDPTPPGPDDASSDAPGAQPPEPGLGPPPGQDGTPAPPSEFLTPVRPYETIDPGAEPTWPASERTPPAPASPRRRSGAGAAIAAVVLVAAALAWIVGDRSSSGRLEAPPDLVATAGVCAAPDCERIEATVTLSWSSPGGDVDGFQILRSQRVLVNVGPDVTVYEIDGLRIEHSYVFGVRAVRAGETGRLRTARVRTPTPPLEEAQLTGSYRVRETVRSATNLAVVEGIDNPRPGSRVVNTWTFEALCEEQAGACPTTWFSFGPLENTATRYDGTFRSRPADCGGGRTPTTTTMHLVASTGTALDGRWRVDRFRGTMRVRFGCPGGGPSVGVLRVEGRAAS